MRLPRLKHDPSSPGIYHCISRCRGGEFLLGIEEKKRLQRLIHRIAHFTGIDLLTYCLMDNHFHILIRVPVWEGKLTDADLASRVTALNGGAAGVEVERALEEFRRAGQDDRAEEIHARYRRRMNDISAFIQEIKQRFTRWFNDTNHTFGTFWAERFKSVLVADETDPLFAVAGYIDLNPVRAGLVEEPSAYAFCGFGEAMAGSETMQKGIAVIVDDDRNLPWKKTAKIYHLSLSERKTTPGAAMASPSHTPSTRATHEIRPRVIEKNSRLTLQELLLCRVRYFTDGMAIGPPEFVESIFQRERHRFGKKRKTGARALRGGDWKGLACLRDLQIRLSG